MITIKELESQGYKVKTTHFRRFKGDDRLFTRHQIYCVFQAGRILGRMTKEDMGAMLNPRGGATEIVIWQDDKKFVGRALCRSNEMFIRKLGIEYALLNLEKEMLLASGDTQGANNKELVKA